MMSNSPVVEVKAISRTYGSVRALDDVSFSVPAGQVAAFLGPNGAGKTTALKILTGFLAPDSGRALIRGIDIEQEPISAKQLIGYLPENNPLYHDQRVGDFLSFAADARGLTGKQKRAAIERVMQATSIVEVWGKFVGQCSKGFRQRVGLAQALLHDPPLLILDEPTNGLDPLQVVEMRELIRELGKTKTVLLTSHVMSEVEALAERVILLNRGRLVADCSLQDLLCGDDSRANLTVQIEGCSAALAQQQLLAAAEQAGLNISSISQTGLSLEDVFRTLSAKPEEQN